MPMIITPESPLGLELGKWNKPYRYEPFPKMLYRATLRPDGIPSVGEGSDDVFGGQPGAAEAFGRRCQRIVNSEDELRRAVEEGWREGPKEAMAYHEELAKFVSDAAAHRHHEDRLMSEAAKAEAAEADAETMDQVAEVPEKRRGGWPKGKPRTQHSDAA